MAKNFLIEKIKINARLVLLASKEIKEAALLEFADQLEVEFDNEREEISVFDTKTGEEVLTESYN